MHGPDEPTLVVVESATRHGLVPNGFVRGEIIGEEVEWTVYTRDLVVIVYEPLAVYVCREESLLFCALHFV
jgi:hypothetical protein